jgi:hypothetical protein
MKIDITARIYMVYSLAPPIFLPYYGSTLDGLDGRLNTHKSAFNQFLKGKRNYISSFELLKRGEVDIKLVEQFAFDTKEGLKFREGLLYSKLPMCQQKYTWKNR